MRDKVSLVTVGVLVLFLVSCDTSSKETEPTFDVAAGVAAVKAARTELSVAREARAQVRSELQELKDKRRPTEEESARMSELETALKNVDTQVDLAFSENQGQMAAFLNEALNQLPQAPETREVLGLYAEEAVEAAQEFIDEAGDYRRAIESMDTAKSYFEAVDLPVPAGLESALEDAKSLRYVTKDRFDQLKKGMTEEQVTPITGKPFYANVRESVVRGKPVVSWLFNRVDGEVAAIYFQDGKVYAVKWNVKDQ